MVTIPYRAVSLTCSGLNALSDDVCSDAGSRPWRSSCLWLQHSAVRPAFPPASIPCPPALISTSAVAMEYAIWASASASRGGWDPTAQSWYPHAPSVLNLDMHMRACLCRPASKALACPVQAMRASAGWALLRNVIAVRAARVCLPGAHWLV